MPRRLPSLNAMRAFEAAARHLNLTRAAEELLVTHGAVSRQVKALEEELGVPLFERKGGRIALTDAGSELVVTARTAFDLLEAGTSRVARPQRRGFLVVSSSSTFMMRWLIPRLHRFRERHPDIELHHLESFAPVDFDREQVDVAIRMSRPDTAGGTVVIPIIDEEIGPVCGPALVQQARLTEPAQMRDHRLLVSETRPAAWQEWLAAASISLPGLPAAQRFPHVYLMLEAALGGLGIGIGARTTIESDLRSGRLMAPFGFVPSGLSLCLLYARRSQGSPDVVAFRDWMLEEASRTDGAQRVGTGSSPE